jgi:hypothetical protein
MVEETLIRGMVRLLALDITKLSKEVSEQIFWDTYLRWQNESKGYLVEAWKGHEKEYSLLIVDALLEVLQIEWTTFCTLNISQLAEQCERSKKLKPHKMQRAY